jgi:cell fate regulator YaaT (PSP1 superfamily)
MPVEVIQLHSALASLERRAVEVCQQRVIEFALPMIIVDAEYQVDNTTLTFFYESQQRLDFRDLVRDLFKTFRARIWMEAVE